MNNKINIYLFKLKDYTTILIGQKEIEKMPIYKNESDMIWYFIQRGDGQKHRYSENEIEWVRSLGEIDIENIKNNKE
jgi:hypothetical protein